MSMSALPPFVLRGRGRAAALDAIANAPEGWVVRCGPAIRSSEQNRLFHDIVDDFVKAIPEWGGATMDADAWKNVLILSFSKDHSDGRVQLVPDLHGDGLVQIRESSSRMSKQRASALIEFCKAEAAKLGVPLSGDDE